MTIFRVLFSISLCTGIACVVHCSSNPVSPRQSSNNALQTKVNAIMYDVEKLRGFDFIRPVHVGQTTRNDYAANTNEQISKSFSGVELEALSKEYAQMGFLTEADTPLVKILIDFYSGFPAAYYVPGTDSLYIIADPSVSDTLLNIYVSHELTHALDDQNLNLNQTIFPDYSHYNSDADLAQRALIEGDATFTEYSYIVSKYVVPGIASPYDRARTMTESDKSDFLSANAGTQTPIFLFVKSYLPYSLGAALVADAYSLNSSWNGVNGLYSISLVPRSSAEINNGRAPITYFEFNGIQNMLVLQSSSIVFADDDNAGFALLLGLFYGALDSARVNRSLDWTGDRYTFVKRADQTYGTLVWAMAFADAGAATYMFGKLDPLIRQRRLGGLAVTVDSLADSTGGGMTYSYTSSVITTNLKKIGNQIWWLENTGTLTQQIVTLLMAQLTAPGLPKMAHTGLFPATLSGENKKKAIKGLMKYLFKRKN